MTVSGQDQAGRRPHVVIVGGGIAGLAAAFFLRGEPVRLTVLEGASRLGGKLAVSAVAGVAVDEGAESTYAPRAKGSGLISAAGLDEDLVPAGLVSRAIWTRDAMRPLPRQFMGVPADPDDLARAGLLSAAGAARARADLDLHAADAGGDVSVAAYVAGRFGQEVVDRLTDPWLAGVYGGRTEDLSFEATLPPLAAAARRYPTLTEAARSLTHPPRPAPGKPAPPGIATLTSGIGSLPPVLAAAVRAASPGAALRTGAPVTELVRTATGWRLRVGPAARAEYLSADAVIVAVPAGPARVLLAGPAAAAATQLADIPYADLAVVTLAYRPRAFKGGLAARGRSGYLVPAVDRRAVKEVTFSTVKWPHLAGEVEIVRCAVGRFGEAEWLGRDDAELAVVAAAELAEATGVAGPPAATRVTRWNDGLPQYLVGHRHRVAAIRAAVAAAPGLAVCGAAYDGVGVATCVASARKAADQALAAVRGAASVRSS